MKRKSLVVFGQDRAALVARIAALETWFSAIFTMLSKLSVVRSLWFLPSDVDAACERMRGDWTPLVWLEVAMQFRYHSCGGKDS